MDLLSFDWLLAVDEAKPAAPGDALQMFLPFIAVAVLFYFLLIRPQRREQATKDAMLAALKKNDKVVTIGGMIGTVAIISSDGQEVTLKGEGDTRIKVIRSSIHRIVTETADPEKPAETK